MAFLGATAALSRARSSLTRATDIVIEVIGGAAVHALSERELQRLGVLIDAVGSSPRTMAIDAWEEQWWAATLPKRPGRILVAGCGAGREIAWLLERGWEAEAFDASASLAVEARRRASGRARVDVLDFAGFVRDAHRRLAYDAVVIGGGALSQCLSDLARRQLIAACAALCPKGPILLSWQDGTGLHERRGRRRAHALGARIGQALGELRGCDAAWRDQVRFVAHAGPTAFLEVADLEALAASVGRRAVLHHEPMPHGEIVVSGKARSASVLDAAATDLLGEVLRSRGVHFLVARGGSMRPAIPSGTQVRLEHARSATLGDVVAARMNGSLVIHRVIGLDSTGHMLIKGDACPTPDGWIEHRDLIGKVASIDDGSGARTVPPCSTPPAGCRRAVGRVARAWRALT